MSKLTFPPKAFFLLAMAFLSLIYLILALRTNIVFVMIFFTLMPAFSLLAGAYWQMANGASSSLPTKLIVAAGAFAFVTSCCGWWIFFAIMLASLDFPFQLPGKYPLQPLSPLLVLAQPLFFKGLTHWDAVLFNPNRNERIQ